MRSIHSSTLPKAPVAQKQILPKGCASLAELCTVALIHERIPNVSQFIERQNMVPHEVHVRRTCVHAWGAFGRAAELIKGA
jgi:hypothetical protein